MKKLFAAKSKIIRREFYENSFYEKKNTQYYCNRNTLFQHVFMRLGIYESYGIYGNYRNYGNYGSSENYG